MQVVFVGYINATEPELSFMQLIRDGKVMRLEGAEVDERFSSGVYWAKYGLPAPDSTIRWMQVTGGHSDHAFVDKELTSLCGKITRSKHQTAGTGHGRKCKRCLDELNASPPEGD